MPVCDRHERALLLILHIRLHAGATNLHKGCAPSRLMGAACVRRTGSSVVEEPPVTRAEDQARLVLLNGLQRTLECNRLEADDLADVEPSCPRCKNGTASQSPVWDSELDDASMKRLQDRPKLT